MTDDAYVVALERAHLDDAPRDWQEVVRATPGITVLGAANPLRMQVRASAEAIAAVRERLSPYVQVEKVILHYQS
jgi:hypothetical protein